MRRPGIARIGVPEIIPEGVDALARMKRAERVGPALANKPAVRLAHLRPKQRIVHPALRLVDVEIGRHHVVIAGKHDGCRRTREARRRARSNARTSGACTRTWGRARDCRWAGRGSRSPCRSPWPRCSGCGCRRDRRADRAVFQPGRCRGPGWRRRSSFSAHARWRHSRPREWRAAGNFSCGAFSSCRQTMSGAASSSQRSNTGSRPFTPFTL